ncbi:TAB2 homolog, chloroplastic [Seminavis robusta]|uniref:TAB2 homolog, chloroplastic n=1 Tax=Seminavis robusta TaxID=568900 RepID=A0A9N8DRN4_9STRA|nr:TAB2 homolog, chloroplastic [Seminavis robusta]|eukprot:Sro321_g116800.1 TAB2 homolog, chloroplastic (369) ;mRNA; r:51902-53157
MVSSASSVSHGPLGRLQVFLIPLALVLACLAISPSLAFTTSSPFSVSPRHQSRQLFSAPSPSEASSTGTTDGVEFTRIPEATPSDEWELDCYSRPVVINGKKLWEVLITDSTGSFRYVKTLPSNQVNSKQLRTTVETMVEDYVDQYDLEAPSIIRFFRGAMFNMINIALTDLDVSSRPSRCTFALGQWLEERHRDTYPKMEGYRASMVGAAGPSFMDVRTPVKLPDALRGEQYAFVGLPLAEFLPGGDISQDNIGVGKLCPIDPTLPADAFVQGVVILTQRAPALASWLAGTEAVALKCDLRKRQLVMETDIDTQYLVARLDDVQRMEGAAFEEGKDALNGLHFVSVQKDDESDPAGFWLLREIPTGI